MYVCQPLADRLADIRCDDLALLARWRRFALINNVILCVHLLTVVVCTTSVVANRWLLATIVIYRLLSIILGHYIIFSNDVGVTTFSPTGFSTTTTTTTTTGGLCCLFLFCTVKCGVICLFRLPPQHVSLVSGGGNYTYLSLNQKRNWDKKLSVSPTIFEYLPWKNVVVCVPSVFGTKAKTSHLQRRVRSYKTLLIKLLAIRRRVWNPSGHSFIHSSHSFSLNYWPWTSCATVVTAAIAWMTRVYPRPSNFVIFVEFN